MNVELSSIYLEIWSCYIDNSHTNEHDLLAGINQLSQADFDISAESQLAMLSLACNCTSSLRWLKSIFATLSLIQLLSNIEHWKINIKYKKISV